MNHFKSLLVVIALLMSGPAFADLEIEEYLERAEKAIKRGDWQDAATNYAQAINHADRPRGAKEWSELNIAYGRAMGVQCKFEDAATYQQRGREIAEKGGTSAAPAVYEAASLAWHRGQVEVAMKSFADLRALGKGGPPPGLSAPQWKDALEKTAAALAQSGRADEAEVTKREAAAVAVPAARDAKSLVTPYGKSCAR